MAIPDTEMELFKMATEKINQAIDVTNVATAQAAVALDTMLQLQKEKDTEYLTTIENIDKRNIEERANIRKHYQKIILALALTLLLIIGSLIGGVIYIVSNFDFEFQPSYSQSVSAEGGGDSTIEAGINVNWPSPTE